jgi:protease-4
MLKKKFMAFLFLLFTAETIIYAAENPFPVPPSALSAGYSEGSFSSMINPVFSDLYTTDDAAYRYLSYNDEDMGNHFASLNLFGFDLIYSRYNSIPGTGGDSMLNSGVNLYSLNRGFFFGNVFGFGAGYSFGRSEDELFDDYSGWNAGLLFRPFSFLSIGVVFRDLNGTIGGEKIDRSDVYSISLRPWKDYLTLSADCVKKEKVNFKDAEFYYSGEFKGYKDISLILKYGTDKSFTAGLKLPFFVRSGSGSEITLDAYGSGNSETSDFKSAGIAFKFRRNREAIHIAAADNFINLKIDDNYAAEREESVFLTKSEPTFQDLVRGIEKAGDDSSIKGIIMEIDSAGFGMAQVQEIRDLLNKFRSRGKKVYTVLNYSGNKEYYLATASDRIFFTPNTTFKITGLSAKAYFLKGLLDKGGVKFESFSKGRYKSFSETFTRKDMSKDARENLTAILTDLNEQFIAGITEERKLTRPAIDELFRKGFYTPAEAKEKGFIDEVMYTNEAADSIRKKAGTISFEDYIDEEESISSWGDVPAIAVINVTGSIVSGRGGGSAMSGSTGDYEYKHSIESAFADSSVKAVVIRIDSGGGSAAASDYMWNALSSAKKKNPKPVVFSFGNVAASGGYYIACTGDTIFAGKGTITGSIGVVAGKVTAEELYSKLGITTETIKMSEFADIFSESRSLTQNDKDLFQKDIDFIYDRFTGKVMEGRGISGNEITEVAEGKIHTGSAAKGNKLVNETGGLIAAIEFAKSKGDVDSEYRILNFPEEESFFEGIFSGTGSLTAFKSMKFIIQNIEKYRMFEKEEALYIQPYTIEIQ